MEFDLIIQDGTVVDGSGQPGRLTDVGVNGDRIVAVDDLSLATSRKSLDASGKVVSPGFVDIHSHSDFSLLLDPAGESKVRQGVTTEVIGNCSFACYPVRSKDTEALQATYNSIQGKDLSWDWTDLEGYRRHYNNQGATLNVAPLAGHTPLRVAAMGYEDRAPTADELAKMQNLLSETMEQGAFGFSAGLTLVPSSYANTDELVALCEVAAHYGGYYAAHMRVYPDKQVAARRETIEIGRRAGIAVQMSHNNVGGPMFWHLLSEILEMIERESAAGVDVSFDAYPYQAGMSHVDQLMPGWAQEGGVGMLIARLRNPTTRRKIYDALVSGRANGLEPWDWEAIMVTDVQPPGEPAWEGKTVGQVATMLGVDGLEAFLTLTECRACATFHFQSEDNTRLLLQHPLGMVCSDGWAVTIGTASLRGKPHPRFFGTFPRVIGRYVREQKMMSIEEAVRKSTSTPANRVGLRDRGLIVPGGIADLTIFDPLTLVDHATYVEPRQYSTGIDTVIVAGQVILEEGEMTGKLPGKVLIHA